MQPDYSKVEQLLFRGFLTSKIYVGSMPLVLKSLNQNEQQALQLRARDGYDSIITHQLAYSILYLNGINVLEDREHYFPTLLDGLKSLSNALREKLIVHLKHLNSQALQALNEVQPYSHGESSRHQWDSRQDLTLNSPSFTGIPGTEKIGLNSHQEVWTSMNRRKDKEEQLNQDWDIGAFIASAWNPDGVDKVRKKRQRKLDEQREIDRTKYQSKGKQDVAVSRQGEIHINPETPEELEREMEKGNAGERDWHDRMVEKHEEEIRDRFEEKRARIEEKKRQQLKKRQEKLRGPKKAAQQEGFAVFEEDDLEDHLSEQASQKEDLREKGLYKEEAILQENEGRLQQWNILEGEDKIARREPGGPEPETSDSPESMKGTPLEDHYREVNEEMEDPNPDIGEMPDPFED